MSAARRPVPVVADVDTGVDDAIALLWLGRSRDVDLLAVSCVAGNCHLDQVVSNTLDILRAAGRPDIPVGRGAARPLVERPRPATGFHGNDGLGDLMPGRERRSTQRSALEVLHAALMASEQPVVVIGLAPLTNIALLLSVYPECAERIERIVFMGGAVNDGNATATAEFNAWHDPEALAIVLNSEVPVTMYGLDVFRTARVDDARHQVLAKSEHKSAPLAARLLDYIAGKYGASGDMRSPSLGDGGAAIVAVHPKLARSARYPVSVVLSGPARGQTSVDRRRAPGEDSQHGERAEAHEIDVVLEIMPGVVNAFIDTLTSVPGTSSQRESVTTVEEPDERVVTVAARVVEP